jgi:hypothetical protein
MFSLKSPTGATDVVARPGRFVGCATTGSLLLAWLRALREIGDPNGRAVFEEVGAAGRRVSVLDRPLEEEEEEEEEDRKFDVRAEAFEIAAAMTAPTRLAARPRPRSLFLLDPVGVVPSTRCSARRWSRSALLVVVAIIEGGACTCGPIIAVANRSQREGGRGAGARGGRLAGSPVAAASRRAESGRARFWQVPSRDWTLLVKIVLKGPILRVGHERWRRRW